MKKKYKVETYGWGTFYRWAKSSAAAVQRVVYMVFGRGYEGYDHEHWHVTEVPA